MNEIVFTYDLFPLSPISIFWSEVEEGLRRMHIAENYDEIRDVFKQQGLAPWIENRENYQTLDAFMEADVVNLITHETVHCVVFDLEGRGVSSKLNILDSDPKFFRCLR